MSKKTALFDCHKELGGSLVEFANTLLPVRFSSEKAEHIATRNGVGIFDVSHMGEFFVEGEDAFDFLQFILSNNISTLKKYQAQYTLLLNKNAGIIDDLIVYKFHDQKFMLCVNAGNIEKDWEWIKNQSHKFSRLSLSDQSKEFSQIAVQGPKAFSLLKEFCHQELPDRFCFSQIEFESAGKKFSTLVAHTGYTGEEGVEIFVSNDNAKDLWNMLLSKKDHFNVLPCGLAARDSLRLEAGFCLHGQDISEQTTPLEAKLMFAVDLNKKDFIGKNFLLTQKAEGVKKKFIGFKLLERGIPRSDYKIFDSAQNPIGFVTSGTWPPNHETAIGLGYVDSTHTKLGGEILIGIRQKMVKAKIVRPRFLPKS